MVFKLAHLSDLHLDYKSGRKTTSEGVNIREQDGYDVFHEIVSQVIDEQCDAVVVCGDTLHTPHPNIRSLVEAQRQFRRFAEAGIKVYALAGNHDTNDLKADVAASKVLDDPFRGIYSHVEPYAHHEIAPGINLHLVSHHMYGEQGSTFEDIKPIEGEVNIFSTHGSVIDPLLQEKLHAEQSPREIVIPDFLFADYDWSYALLGHIHERGWVGSKDKKTDTSKTKVYYNGSAIRRGFSDKEVPLGRGWTLWNIHPDGKMVPDIRKIMQRTQRDFSIINAKDLTPSEITDEIIENFKTTQTDGRNFIEIDAPILRQRISNLSPAKHAALDFVNINLEASHTLLWSLKPMSIEETEARTHSEDFSESISKNADVVEVYDLWIDKSEKLSLMNETHKDKTKKQARKFVQLGQDANLNEE